MTIRSVKLSTLKKKTHTELFNRTVNIQAGRGKIGRAYLRMEPGTKGYAGLMKRDKFLIAELHKVRKAQVHIRKRGRY